MMMMTPHLYFLPHPPRTVTIKTNTTDTIIITTTAIPIDG